MKKVLNVIIFIFHLAVFGQKDAVLSSGTWYKLGVTETGIYKIDRTTLDMMGVAAGVSTQSVDIYGNSQQGILPQQNDLARPDDLLQNAIFVQNSGDTSFESSDYLLFYAVGPDKADWSTGEFEYEKNSYSDTAYYFLTFDSEEVKRIEEQDLIESEPSQTINTFNDHIIEEKDISTVLHSGRSWLGDLLNNQERLSYSVPIENAIGDPLLYFKGVSRSPAGANFDITVNGRSYESATVREVPSGPNSTYQTKAYEGVVTNEIEPADVLNLEILFDGKAGNGTGYLDYWHLTFERSLQFMAGNELRFRSTAHDAGVVEYVVSNSEAGVSVWDVSLPTEVKALATTTVQSTTRFLAKAESRIPELIAFKGSTFPSPFFFGRVENQNLHADLSPEGVIITHPQFLGEAERLANFHRTHNNLTVKVVTTWQVYNEFSSGRQDVSAIRDYMKYLYDRGQRLKYLTLFGDCSVDYKYRLNRNTNFVPTYESRNSYHPIFSYSSDDYFAFLEEGEGEWIETSAGDHTMEIGVGRLPVKSVSEAKEVVDKIIYYSTSPNTLGRWRNEISYLADDADGNIHMRHVEELSELIDTTYAQYGINKILLDAFDQISGTTENASPQTTNALKTRIKNGTFSINFIGHGNERQWTDEEILTKETIREFTNLNRLPIFVTATCEFGKYDDPREVSGAEELLLSSTGGAIALLTTSRPVFASTNFSLNEAFHDNIFKKVNGANQRLGDIIRLTKNEGLEGAVNRNFTLLGDPMMMPAFPKLEIQIAEENAQLDTLSALEEVTINGTIVENGVVRTDFNGELYAVILDVEQTFTTKGQESNPYSYTKRSNALFRGETVVENGAFSFTFIVPKNISYQFERGKISLYAMDKDNNLDAAGSSRAFKIGGTHQSEIDQTPPILALFLNDESFSNGGTVGSYSIFIAKVSDESGITTSSSGIVEGISLLIDDEFFNLNEFYIADKEGYQSGTVTFPIQNLAPGRHTANLKVWDTHNNQSEEIIDFYVTDEPTIFITNQAVYPNPIENMATFRFNHDREEEDLRVTLLVYDGTGTVASKVDYRLANSAAEITLPWAANSVGGFRLSEGIYYYRLIIRSELDGATKEITNKLVITD